MCACCRTRRSLEHMPPLLIKKAALLCHSLSSVPKRRCELKWRAKNPLVITLRRWKAIERLLSSSRRWEGTPHFSTIEPSLFSEPANCIKCPLDEAFARVDNAHKHLIVCGHS